MKEIIRKFDEDISIKANKIELTIVKEEMFKSFIDNSKWNLIQNDF